MEVVASQELIDSEIPTEDIFEAGQARKNDHDRDEEGGCALVASGQTSQCQAQQQFRQRPLARQGRYAG